MSKYIVETVGEPYVTNTMYYNYETLEKARKDAVEWVLKNKRTVHIYEEVSTITLENRVIIEEHKKLE